ncbi:macro domain-containing protein [Oceanobacillus sp. FSL W8-0428]|uniref:macro domain-containing protein n=1 Tax=Oceanobacillus sp. FSL W8-0428 TaxID=2921715 RepID=UPI0030F56C5A
MFIVPVNSLKNPKYIINFPTKRHWRNKSRLDDIKIGLMDLKKEIERLDLKSIAIPPLGCGNGGLKWEDIRPLIELKFKDLDDVQIQIYEPGSPPQPDQMKIGTSKPKMTKSRALFLAAMKEYTVPGYKLSLLEIQKIGYFLQALGEPLRLNYVKYYYGPYAENLNHVL